MRPGEVIPGDGPVPAAVPGRTATIRIVNRGRLPASLSSHVPLEWVSPTLEFPRDGLCGARLLLPAGASTRIEPGAEVEVEVMWS
jgi:urease beta subunit